MCRCLRQALKLFIAPRILVFHSISIESNAFFLSKLYNKKQMLISRINIQKSEVLQKTEVSFRSGLSTDIHDLYFRRNISQPSKASLSAKHYWHDENDTCIIQSNENFVTGESDSYACVERKKYIKFTIRGKPLPLIRHRSSRGFIYNPSSSAQGMFRDCLLKILPRKYHPVVIDEEQVNFNSKTVPNVFFSKDEFLEMSVSFRLKRPKSHFTGNKPGPGRLKADAPRKFHTSRSDVDNLAKFVLDSLNGILYVDDRQVVSLNAIKMLDSDGMCEGATDVTITALYNE